MSAAVEKSKRVRITNKKAADAVLPPVSGKETGGKDWPALRILPGGYNVDAEYLEAIRGPKATPGARKGWEKLTTDYGDGPHLVVSENAKAVKAKEGPEPPKSLRAYGEDQAEKIVEHIDDVDALELWLKNETRGSVRDAIERRLSAVK